MPEAHQHELVDRTCASEPQHLQHFPKVAYTKEDVKGVKTTNLSIPANVAEFQRSLGDALKKHSLKYSAIPPTITQYPSVLTRSSAFPSTKTHTVSASLQSRVEEWAEESTPFVPEGKKQTISFKDVLDQEGVLLPLLMVQSWTVSQSSEQNRCIQSHTLLGYERVYCEAIQ